MGYGNIEFELITINHDTHLYCLFVGEIMNTPGCGLG